MNWNKIKKAITFNQREFKAPEGVDIRYEKPPSFDNICATFKLNLENMIFTYGDTIYVPVKKEIFDHTIVHEKVHMRQQKHSAEGAALWWGKFLRDPDFRIQQEAEAYAEQYRFICRRVFGKENRYKVLSDLAKVLAGPIYGHAITQAQAENLIKKL